ncbi:hypothetical protein Fmac_014548 [Flemingia macrophylla]|uniref:C2 domain-containing protein n=1 Tax=Flemingia macrophylla TaxID=520843 RepID=A0ABD1ME13_9FABA
MASWRPPPSKSVDLDLTIVSAKQLKNVNWKNGDLKAYVVFWVDPERRLATKSDESGSTSPVWNERFTLPLPLPLHDSSLTLEIFHSKPSDTPKPLVATLRLPLKDLHDLHHSSRLRKFPLLRPSGRPHGKIHLKLGLLPRPHSHDYPPPPTLTPTLTLTLTLTLTSSATEAIPLLPLPLLTLPTPLTPTLIPDTTPVTIPPLLPLPLLPGPSSTATLGPLALPPRSIIPPPTTPSPRGLPNWASLLAPLLVPSAASPSMRDSTAKRTESPRGAKTTSPAMTTAITE